jgi:hypothetical protein
MESEAVSERPVLEYTNLPSRIGPFSMTHEPAGLTIVVPPGFVRHIFNAVVLLAGIAIMASISWKPLWQATLDVTQKATLVSLLSAGVIKAAWHVYAGTVPIVLAVRDSALVIVRPGPFRRRRHYIPLSRIAVLVVRRRGWSMSLRDLGELRIRQKWRFSIVLFRYRQCSDLWVICDELRRAIAVRKVENSPK